MDNNILHLLFKQHPTVVGNASKVSAATAYISSIAIGEIRFGQKVNPTATTQAQQTRTDFDKFVQSFRPHILLPVTEHTAEPYAYLRSNLFDKFSPKAIRPKRPEQLNDPVSGHSLGIDENDLWMCAQAIEHNLVFVSNDKNRHIKAADLAGRLTVENWTI